MYLLQNTQGRGTIPICTLIIYFLYNFVNRWRSLQNLIDDIR